VVFVLALGVVLAALAVMMALVMTTVAAVGAVLHVLPVRQR